MTRFHTLIVILCLLPLPQLWAQCQPQAFNELAANQVRARYYNGGDQFWDLEGFPAYEVPKGSGTHPAFASGLWLGGLDQGDGLHVAAATYRQVGYDYYPGPVRWTGDYECSSFSPTQSAIQEVTALADGRIVFLNSLGLEVTNLSRTSSQFYPYPSNRAFPGIQQLNDGRLLIFGDSNFPNQLPMLTVDTSTFAYTVHDTLSVWHGRSRGTLLPNGEVLIAGLFGVDRFDPVTNTTTPAAPMGTPRVRTSSLVLPGGEVWVVGGSTTLNGLGGSTLTELYFPTTDTWLPGPNLGQPRLLPSLGSLSNGQYLILGGNAQSPDVEVFDPVGNQITSPFSLPEPFTNSFVVAQGNGQFAVLVESMGPSSSDFFVLNGLTGDVRDVPISQTLTSGTLLPNGNFYVESRINGYQEFDLQTLVPVGQKYQKIWKVSQTEIDEFLLDYSNGSVDFDKYPDIGSWPGNGNLAKGEDQYLAPFIDVDLDGVYDPLNDGDYPCIEGEASLWWVFNDIAGPHTQTSGDALGVQIEAMAWAYDCQSQPCNYSATDFTTFLRYEITNKSPNDYKDVYVGQWTDVDLGSFADDFVGCDTNRGLAFVYNGLPSDAIYGNNPPAWGSQFVSTPDGSNSMTNFIWYINDFSVQGNPTAPHHYYNYLQSIWTDGTPLTEGGNGYGGSVPTKYMYSGDPGFCGGNSAGWSEVSAGNTPFDRSFLQSYGPFDLPRDSSITVDLMFVYNQAFINPPLGSVCELQTASDSVSSWYRANKNDCESVVTNSGPDPTPAAGLDLWPNPASRQVRISLEQAVLHDAPITFHDQLGRVVASAILPAGQQQISCTTEALADGVYTVQVRDRDAVFSRKLVLQR